VFFSSIRRIVIVRVPIPLLRAEDDNMVVVKTFPPDRTDGASRRNT
jgi:hypothetical protein